MNNNVNAKRAVIGIEDTISHVSLCKEMLEQSEELTVEAQSEGSHACALDMIRINMNIVVCDTES